MEVTTATNFYQHSSPHTPPESESKEVLEPVINFPAASLRAKIAPDEAESEGCGGTTVEDDNEVWRNLRRNPKGWGQFDHISRRGFPEPPDLMRLFPQEKSHSLPSMS